MLRHVNNGKTALGPLGGSILLDGGGVPDEPAFICDLMLQKMCRWMRMAGFDVLSPKELDDDGLVELCIRTDRFLLTRDKELSDRKMIRALRIGSEDVDGQLKELTLAFPELQGRSRASRCPLCNQTLTIVDRKDLKDVPDHNIPEKVLQYQRTFYLCRNCAKTYWKGTHWVRIEDRLKAHGLITEEMRAAGTEK